MRLKSIKLAGFKSFVDATTVQFPTNLSAVVGPNGCGKSNVIDAVRWVMGESSAKNLRGESMTDVIFNGSSSRQPAGQASIELVFDNSDHTIQGEWNQFAEVAIKRKVTRDAQNTYYINGTKCRRKDITDIFLGTGLGPRSYAIIEQGMISRLIEAKPDDLRVFIEEAAGISKYKERRRDTENRIRRTRENLERLTDIRDELGRQLERLARQAAAAEKYRNWRQEERALKHQVIAYKWLQLDESRGRYDTQIASREAEIERLKTDRMASASKIDALRTQAEEQKSEFDTVQARYFQVGAEIARLEQASQHAEARRREITREINELQQRISSSGERARTDQQRVEEAKLALADIVPALEAAEEDMLIAESGLEQFLIDESELREQFTEYQRQEATREQRVESAQRQIFSLQQQVGQFEEQRDRARDQLKQLRDAVDDGVIAVLRESYEEHAMQLEVAREQLTALEEGIEQTRADVEIQKTIRDALTEERHAKSGRLHALDTLLAQRSNAELSEFLSAHQLADAPKLIDSLNVPKEWQRVVSSLVSDGLQAPVEPSLGSTGVPGLVRLEASSQTFPSDSLAALLSGDAIPPFLGNLLVVSSVDVALQRRSELATHESFITVSGVQVGTNFIRWVGEIDQVSEFELTEERALLVTELDSLDQRLEQIQAEITNKSNALISQRDVLVNEKRQYESTVVTTQQVERELAVAQTSYDQSMQQITRANY